MARGPNRGLNIDWNFPFQNGFINNRGETLIHEIGMRCSCNNEDLYAGETTHGPDVPRRKLGFGCQKCGGEGFIFRKARKIIALLTGVRQTKSQLEAGWAMPGDAIVSVKPDILISGGDLLTFTWPEVIPDGQVVMRGAAHINDNKTRKTFLQENEDKLWYNAVEALHCEDEDGKVYRNNGDFILDGSKVIKWVGAIPLPRKLYTIKYKAYLEWVVFFPPDVRRDRDRDLGLRVMIRKRHVALANKEPHGAPSDKTPFCERLSGCSV